MGEEGALAVEVLVLHNDDTINGSKNILESTLSDKHKRAAFNATAMVCTSTRKGHGTFKQVTEIITEK